MLQEEWRAERRGEARLASGSGRHSARGVQNIGQQNPHKMHGLWLLQFWLFLFPCQGRAVPTDTKPVPNRRSGPAAYIHTARPGSAFFASLSTLSVVYPQQHKPDQRQRTLL